MESHINIEKLKKSVKNAGDSAYAIGWVAIGLNIVIYLWSIFDKNYSESGLLQPTLFGVLVMLIISTVFVILGGRIKGVTDKNIKKYIEILLVLSLVFAIGVVVTGGRIGLLFFLVLIYLASAHGSIKKLMTVDEFTSTLRDCEYKLNKRGWVIFSISSAMVLLFAFIATSYSSNQPKENTEEVSVRQKSASITDPDSLNTANFVCESNRNKMVEKMEATFWSSYFIDEIFHSPKIDACLFGVSAIQNQGEMHKAYIIWDYVTGDMDFYRDTTLTNGQDISDIYHNALRYLQGKEDLRYDPEKDWRLN